MHARESRGRTSSAPDVVVAGHVCLDIIPSLFVPPDLRPGSLLEVGPATLSPGGPVGNVGLALHRLGVPVRLMGKVGDDQLGRALLDVLRREGTDLVSAMIVAPGETTSYSVVFNPPSVDRAFLHCPGANHTFAAADVPLDQVEGTRILHFGYPPVMRRFYRDGGVELRNLLSSIQAKEVVTSLDVCRTDPHGEAGRVDWASLLKHALPAVDLFAPSFDELVFMLLGAGAHEPLTLASLRALASRVLALGPPLVAVKLGDQGLYLKTAADGRSLDRLCSILALDRGDWRDREVLAPCFRPREIAGTTGAGDCTIAGLLAALLRADDPVGAVTAATAVGGCSVEAADATSGLSAWATIAARVAAGWERLPMQSELLGGAAWRQDARGTLFDPMTREP